MQRHDCSDVMTFYALFKTVCNTGGKFEKEKKTNDKSSASKQLPCEGRGSEIGLSFILVRYKLISNFQELHFS